MVAEQKKSKMGERKAKGKSSGSSTAKAQSSNDTQPSDFGISVPARPDVPSTKDSLNREHFVKALAALIGNENTGTPLSIGIYGSWGSGKSSFMEMVRQELEGFRFIDFNVWRYKSSEEVWTVFIKKVVEAMDSEMSFWQKLKYLILRNPIKTFNKLKERTIAAGKKIGNWFTVGLGTLGFQLNVWNYGENALTGAWNLWIFDVPKTLSFGETSMPTLAFSLFALVGTILFLKTVQTVRHPLLTQFEAYAGSSKGDTNRFRQLTQTDLAEISGAIRREIEKGKKKKPIVIFLDDLDRCRPDRIVEVLEAINLSLSGLPFITVIGVDSRVVCMAIAERYKFMLPKNVSETRKVEYGRQYLEKIIQIPFQLVRPSDFSTYINDLVGIEARQKKEEEDLLNLPNPANILEGIEKKPFYKRPFLSFWLTYTSSIISFSRFYNKNWKTSPYNWRSGISFRAQVGLDLTEDQSNWLKNQSPSNQAHILQVKDYLLGRKTLWHFFWPLKELNKIYLETKEKEFQKTVQIAENDKNVLAEFSSDLKGNPRTIKRFINIYQLAKAILYHMGKEALDKNQQMDLANIAAWLVLNQNWPRETSDLYFKVMEGGVQSNMDVLFFQEFMDLPIDMEEYIYRNAVALKTLTENPVGLAIVESFSYFGIQGASYSPPTQQ